MGKTVQQWYDLIALEKSTMSNLTDLTPNVDTHQDLLRDVQSPSKVADWRLWISVLAYAAYLMDALYDLFRADVEAKINRAYGTPSWYKKKSLEFQYADPLVWLVDNYGYAVIDETKQIVKRVSLIEIGRRVRIKVANYVGGVITPLTITELAAFDAYIKAIRPAGVKVTTSSNNADTLKVGLKVYYNPLLLDNAGQSLSAPGSYPVEDAVNLYLSELDFGGVFDINSLTDKVQATSGVVRPYVTLCEARFGGLPYSPIAETYIADAGWMIIDPAFPLTAQIQYIASV